jgi:hypothetical protein
VAKPDPSESLKRLKYLSSDDIRTQIAAKENPKALAAKDEVPNAALSVDTEGFSSSERSIIREGTAAYKMLSEQFEDIYSHEKAFRTSLNLDDHFRQITLAAGDCQSKIDIFVKSQTQSLKLVYEDLERKRYQYRKFRTDNRLKDIEPAYSPTPLFHFAIVIVFVILEAFLNSNFLARGSEFGLLGGALQSIIFSAINFMLALVFFYFGYQPSTHVNPYIKNSGRFFLVVYFCVLLSVNLVFGHYVDAFDSSSSPLDAATIAFSNFLAGPFDLHTLNAILIVVVGLLFSAIYFFEVTRLDDRYRGYRLKDRQLIDADQRAIKATGAVVSKIQHEAAAKRSEIDTTGSNIRREVQQFKDSIASIERLHQSYSSLDSVIAQECGAMIQEYRDHLFQLRPNAVQEVTGDIDKVRIAPISIAPLLETDQLNVEHYENKVSGLDQELTEQHKALRVLGQIACDKFSDHWKEIDDKSKDAG